MGKLILFLFLFVEDFFHPLCSAAYGGVLAALEIHALFPLSPFPSPSYTQIYQPGSFKH
jgi:hypothetical protein